MERGKREGPVSGRLLPGLPLVSSVFICHVCLFLSFFLCMYESGEDLAANSMKWRSTLNQHLKSGEEKLMNAEVGKRAHTKEHNNSNRPETRHKCNFCGGDCLSHIGLYSHKQWCNNRTDWTTRMYPHDQT